MPEVKCPNGHKLNVPDAYIGQEVRCSVCNATFVAPAAGEEVASPQPGIPDISVTAPASAPVTQPVADGDIAVGQQSVTARQRGRTGSRPFLAFLDSERIGKPMLFLGLVLVILARGCDGLGARWASRLMAKASAEPAKFNQRTKRMLRDKKGDAAQAIRTERNNRKDELSDRWSDMADSAGNARTSQIMWGFFYHCGFLLGSLSLSVGLLVVGFNGTGSERTICLIMIAIITFSIYIVGMPWFEGAVSRMMPGG